MLAIRSERGFWLSKTRKIFIAVYILFILCITLFTRETGSRPLILEPFWELRNGLWHDIFLNILLFIPLGLLLGSWKGLLLGVGVTVFIEVNQFFFHLGYCEIDDVLNNTSGTAIGILIWIGASRTVLKKWEDLPEFMRTPEVKPYWEVLWRKRGQLVLKRIFDFLVALILLIVLIIPMVIIAIMIKIEDPGPVFYRQERVTKYGRHFRIHKFRTMVVNADKLGTAVTVGADPRITKVGRKLRHLRLDELPQVFDVIAGTMCFVGTRPEAVKYVEKYKPEYNATLLMPAGITSEASIRYKDEDKLLNAADDVDKVYVEQVLPEKMKWNLESIEKYSFGKDIATMFRTVFAVLGKDYQ